MPFSVDAGGGGDDGDDERPSFCAGGVIQKVDNGLGEIERR